MGKSVVPGGAWERSILTIVWTGPCEGFPRECDVVSACDGSIRACDGFPCVHVERRRELRRKSSLKGSECSTILSISPESWHCACNGGFPG